MTVNDLLDAYLADRTPVVVDVDNLTRKASILRPHFGGHDIGAITPQIVLDYTARRCERVQPATVRRELIIFKAALRFAWRRGWLPAVPSLPVPSAAPPRQRVLDAAEILRLADACASDRALSLFLAIALATGARRTAICELTWDRVDLDRGIVDLRAPHPRAARRKNRAVAPIPPSLVELLRVIPRDGPRLIAVTPGTIGARLRRAASTAGLDGISAHVLRHTVATELLRHVPLVIASRMLGHRSVAITEQVYGHLAVDDLRPAATATGRMIAEIVQLPAPARRAFDMPAIPRRRGRLRRFWRTIGAWLHGNLILPRPR